VWRVVRPEPGALGGPIDWSGGTQTAVLERTELPPLEHVEPTRDVRPPSRMLGAFLAAVLGAVLGTGATLVATRHSPDGGVVKVAPPVRDAGGGGASDVSAVAKAVLPSIVRIDVRGTSAFGQQREGTGSGVIYNDQGYIVTNNHVIAGADQVQVRFADGTALTARVIGSAAPAVDIAVIKVDPRPGLKPATFGSASELQVGQLAVAIGSPFGLQGSVTSGVISALHRNISLDEETHFSDGIQTDAPINPGNSGGALADAGGRVVGINTAILSGGGGNVGVGFAIPIDIVRRVAEQIIRTGHAQLPFLGVTGQNLAEGEGALLQEVRSGGPAARAGLRAGDIITAVDGQKVASMDDLISILLTKEVGQVVHIEYKRDGSRQTTEARLASRPEG
jgi:putative serine protease PepD